MNGKADCRLPMDVVRFSPYATLVEEIKGKRLFMKRYKQLTAGIKPGSDNSNKIRRVAFHKKFENKVNTHQRLLSV